jgi:hypothetical protein
MAFGGALKGERQSDFVPWRYIGWNLVGLDLGSSGKPLAVRVTVADNAAVEGLSNQHDTVAVRDDPVVKMPVFVVFVQTSRVSLELGMNELAIPATRCRCLNGQESL